MKKLLAAVTVIAAFGLSLPTNAKEIKTAYLPCGQVNDHSWSQAGYEGMLKAKKDLAKKGIDLKISYTESTPPAQAEAAARDYAARGFNPVVLHCGTFTGAAVNAAKAFPKTKFIVATAPATKSTPKNFWYYDAAQQEASFVAGYLGASVSKKGRVGAVGGFQFPALTRQVEAFRLGARYANPKIVSYATYINSWEDAGKAKEAAQAQIDSGADVIFGATDEAARGIFAAAENSGVHAIASYSDQASLAPKTIIVSVIYDYSKLVSMMVEGAVANTLVPGKAYVVGMAGGIGVLVPNPKVYDKLPAGVRSKVAALEAAIKNGKIKVPELTKPNEAASFDLAKLKAK